MSRYVEHSERDRRAMLETLGLSRMEDLVADLPQGRLLTELLNIPAALSELDVVRCLEERAGKNVDPGDVVTFLGAGVYDHFIPAVVPWIVSRPEFSTAYTPYQAEVSQGTLESIYEFQTMICELTGMDVANASMYDGATSVAEAALMAARVTKKHRIVISEAVHPNHLAVVRSYARGGQIEIGTLPSRDGSTDPEALDAIEDAACVIVQSPNFYGQIEPLSVLADRAHEKESLLVASCDPISLAILKPPGALAVDIAVGEGQSLGSPMAFGGPLLGFFASRERFLRQLPGRVVGRTVDAEGRTCYVMTLQTREQHIRRERATSNICTNQALVALAATVYLAALGREGFKKLGRLCIEKSHYAAEQICALPGFSLRFERPFFKEFVVQCPVDVEVLLARLREEGILGGVPLGAFDPEYRDCLLVAVTEKRTRAEIDHFVSCIAAACELEIAGGSG